MQTRFRSAALAVTALLSASVSFPSLAQGLRLLSPVDPAQVPAGAGGDSCVPILSPDGRFVVFASTANNLLSASNNVQLPTRVPGTINVYLRDRAYGTTALVSINLSDTTGGNADSLPAGLSVDGRYVLFESSASDLVPGDTNNASDVFVRDLLNGRTILVSAAINGFPGSAESRSPVMTPDGRFVAFVSAATNLVWRDTNRITDVFVRDLQNEITIMATTNSVTVVQSGNPGYPEISTDGRYVAFYSTATNLVPGVTNAGELYLRDLVANTTFWASSYSPTAVGTNKVAYGNYQLAPDGRFFAYEARATAETYGVILRFDRESGLTEIVETNATLARSAAEQGRTLDMTADGRFIAFVANANTADGTTTCIRLWDAQTGRAVLVSANLDDAVPIGSACGWPRLDASGRYVAFLSSATNMVPNVPGGDFHLYLRDTATGAIRILDANAEGMGANLSPATMPSLSTDARFVAFETEDSPLVANDRNRASDVFLRDLVTEAVELVSAHDLERPTAAPDGPSTLTPNSVSADGRYLAFASEAGNLRPNDTNGFSDIFVADLAGGTVRLVSLATNGLAADGPSTEPAISGDGRFVAFTSVADNLVPGDTNRQPDVFLCDLETGVTTLVSVNTNSSAPASGVSFSPMLDHHARHIVFRSTARDIVRATYISTTENLFVRDMELGRSDALCTAGALYFPASMSADGKFVCYGGSVWGALSAGFIGVWDTDASRTIYSNYCTVGTNAGYASAVITPDGRRVAFSLYSLGVWTLDLPSLFTRRLSSSAHKDLRISADGQWLACRAMGTSGLMVFLYDLSNFGRLLVSHAYGSAAEAQGGEPDSLAISPDGRLVAYRSSATNIVAHDNNQQSDVFVYNRQTRSNTALNADGLGETTSNYRSLLPIFAPDGSALLVESSSFLSAGDFNPASDIFSLSFLTTAIQPSITVGQGPWISWPWVPGWGYEIQYKNSLLDPTWNTLPGTQTNNGTRAWLQDKSPIGPSRFYRLRRY